MDSSGMGTDAGGRAGAIQVSRLRDEEPNERSWRVTNSAGQVCTRHNVPVIGLDSPELRWVRTLVSLLRHPDPAVPELTRQALDYLTDSAAQRDPAGVSEAPPLDHTG